MYLGLDRSLFLTLTYLTEFSDFGIIYDKEEEFWGTTQGVECVVFHWYSFEGRNSYEC